MTILLHYFLIILNFFVITLCRELIIIIAWYLKVFVVRQHIRAALATVTTMANLDALIAQIDPHQEANADVMAAPRGRTGSSRTPALPDRWLESDRLTSADALTIRHAELAVSGG